MQRGRLKLKDMHVNSSSAAHPTQRLRGLKDERIHYSSRFAEALFHGTTGGPSCDSNSMVETKLKKVTTPSLPEETKEHPAIPPTGDSHESRVKTLRSKGNKGTPWTHNSWKIPTSKSVWNSESH